MFVVGNNKSAWTQLEGDSHEHLHWVWQAVTFLCMVRDQVEEQRGQAELRGFSLTAQSFWVFSNLRFWAVFFWVGMMSWEVRGRL